MNNKEGAPEALPELNAVLPRVTDLDARIEASREIEALLSGFEGRYIPAGRRDVRVLKALRKQGADFYGLLFVI